MSEEQFDTTAPQPSQLEEIAGTDWLEPASANATTNPKGRHVAGGRWVQIVYALIDIFFVLMNGVVAYVLRFLFLDRFRFSSAWADGIADHQALNRYIGFLILYVSLILLLCQWQHLYRTPRTRSASGESLAILKAVSFATLLLTAFIYLSGVKIVSRSVVVISLLLNVVVLAGWRYKKRRIVMRRASLGINTRNALIVGAGKVGQALAKQFEENKTLGYRFKGFLDANHSGDPRSLGKVEELDRIVRAEFIDEVFVTIPSERELVKRVAVEAQQFGVNVKVIPELYDGLGWNAPLGRIGEFPVMELYWKSVPTVGFFFKRTLDVVLSGLGLVLTIPLLAVLAVWIKLDSPGPVFYRSSRVGRKGCVFVCYKLRTMVNNADHLKDGLRQHNERRGPFFKMKDDPRITRLGRTLRKYSLDELPQLWNVLRSEMSLVGPRPHPLDDYAQYNLDQRRRLEFKPGLTGLWQVTARQDPSFEKNMLLDLEYIENWRLFLDLKILAKTFPAVFQGDGQ